MMIILMKMMIDMTISRAVKMVVVIMIGQYLRPSRCNNIIFVSAAMLCVSSKGLLGQAQNLHHFPRYWYPFIANHIFDVVLSQEKEKKKNKQ